MTKTIIIRDGTMKEEEDKINLCWLQKIFGKLQSPSIYDTYQTGSA